MWKAAFIEGAYLATDCQEITEEESYEVQETIGRAGPFSEDQDGLAC